MIDFGFDKIALIGAVALIVIGPEKLPRVARTVGTLMGKARRYVADVKAEVNRSIELEELQKMKSQFETAANDVSQSVAAGFGEAQSAFSTHADDLTSGLDNNASGTTADGLAYSAASAYKPPRKNWRLKRSAMPRWYKQQAGVRGHVQSGAARVARHRPSATKRG